MCVCNICKLFHAPTPLAYNTLLSQRTHPMCTYLSNRACLHAGEGSCLGSVRTLADVVPIPALRGRPHISLRASLQWCSSYFVGCCTFGGGDEGCAGGTCWAQSNTASHLHTSHHPWDPTLNSALHPTCFIQSMCAWCTAILINSSSFSSMLGMNAAIARTHPSRSCSISS